MKVYRSTLLALLVGCGGGFNTAGDCEDGYKRADDGNCYPTGLDDDTGTSSGDDLDGDGDADGGGGGGGDGGGGPDGGGGGDADGGGGGDADGGGGGDADGGGGGDADGGGGGDVDEGPPPDEGGDVAEGDPDIEDGDCSTTISGVSSVGWASGESMALLIGVASGNACDAAPLEDHLDTLMQGLLGPFEPGMEGAFEVTDAVIEDPNVSLLFIQPPAGGSGEPTVTEYTSGTLTLTTPAMAEGGLFGELDASSSGGSLSGSFNACWCDTLVAEVEFMESNSGG